MIKILNEIFPRDLVNHIILPLTFNHSIYSKLILDLNTLRWIHLKYFTQMSFIALYFDLYQNINKKKKRTYFLYINP